MWIVVYVSEQSASIQAAKECLEREGILVQMRSRLSCFELAVMTSEAVEARDILLERGL